MLRFGIFGHLAYRCRIAAFLAVPWDKLIVACAVWLGSCAVVACASELKAASEHEIRFVEVAPGVRLEVLDWGGQGNAVVLLAGHGNTAHVFDDFAPSLKDRFHVLGITRRGFGASSEPSGGYDLATMVSDIAHVLDALNLERVDLVGHSIAGDEITRFALTYPEKVGKLVYLDAAYDRVEEQKLEAKFPKLPRQSEPVHGSVDQMREFVARTEIMLPEAEIRATRVFGRDGKYVREVTPDWILRDVANMVEHPEYGRFRAPMLALYSVYTEPSQLAPRYKEADPGVRRSIEQIFGEWQQFAEAQRSSLRKSAPGAHVVEIRGANHYLFISNREEVVREVREFLNRSN